MQHLEQLLPSCYAGVCQARVSVALHLRYDLPQVSRRRIRIAVTTLRECFDPSDGPIFEHDEVSNRPIFTVEITVTKRVSEDIMVPKEEYSLRFMRDECRHRILLPNVRPHWRVAKRL